MREAGRKAASVMRHLKNLLAPGISTKELDQAAQEFIAQGGGKPAFLGYRNYPACICVSVNEEVVHGIPHPKRILQEGDIVGIDLGVICNGYYGDVAATFPVGKISLESQELLSRTRAALFAGIREARVGNRLGDISHAIESSVKEFHYGIVRDFVGHGIGRQLHEEPQVPNYGEPHTGPRLTAGMCLALEPMINLGTEQVSILNDGWTVVTKDGKRSAHFEHTLAITENGPEILTTWE